MSVDQRKRPGRLVLAVATAIAIKASLMTYLPAHAAAAESETVAVAKPHPTKAKRAGRLAVSMLPLTPTERRRGEFFAGEEVNLTALLPGVTGEQVLQGKTARGWKTVRGADTYGYGASFTPRARERVYRLLWKKGPKGLPRVTNTVTVVVTGKAGTETVIAPAHQSLNPISGDGKVIAYRNDDGLKVWDTTGRTETVPAPPYANARALSDDGRYLFYETSEPGMPDPDEGKYNVVVTYRYDRATATTVTIQSRPQYYPTGTQLFLMDVTGDGQRVLLKRNVDGRFDSYLLRDLNTSTDTLVYQAVAGDTSSRVQSTAAATSADGATVAFEIGTKKSRSIHVWRAATGQAPVVATATGYRMRNGSTDTTSVLGITDNGATILIEHQKRLQLLNTTTGAFAPLPFQLESPYVDVANLSGNGTSVLLGSGTFTGVYRIPQRRWVPFHDGEGANISTDGRTVTLMALINDPVRLWKAPF